MQDGDSLFCFCIMTRGTIDCFGYVFQYQVEIKFIFLDIIVFCFCFFFLFLYSEYFVLSCNKSNNQGGRRRWGERGVSDVGGEKENIMYLYITVTIEVGFKRYNIWMGNTSHDL